MTNDMLALIGAYTLALMVMVATITTLVGLASATLALWVAKRRTRSTWLKVLRQVPQYMQARR